VQSVCGIECVETAGCAACAFLIFCLCSYFILTGGDRAKFPKQLETFARMTQKTIQSVEHERQLHISFRIVAGQKRCVTAEYV
jgi:hypothetical protein